MKRAKTICLPGPHWGSLCFAALVLAMASLVKLHCGPADARQLAWLLKPTAALVQLFSGLEFVSLGAEGLYNGQRHVLIAPACSGINFLVIAAALGSLMGGLKLHAFTARLGWLLFTGLLAYGLTLVVNSGRILLAIALYQVNLAELPLSPAQLHRIEGVAVYYLFLCFFSWLLSTILRKTAWLRQGACGRAPGSGYPHVIWPLVCYLAFSLGIPLLNQAWRQQPDRFIEHSLTVAAVSTILALMLRLVLRRKARRGPKPPSHSIAAYETGHTDCRG